MLPEKMEEAFQLNLEAIQVLQNALETSFLEAYIEHMENIIDQYQVRVQDGTPKPEEVSRITELYEKIKNESIDTEDWRRLSQLLLLKGTKFEQLQPNHQLTPDSMGYLFVFIIEQLYPKKKEGLRVLDIASGMGNLLLTVLLNLQKADYETEGIGIDIDEVLLSVAAATSEITQAKTQYYHQDGLQELLIDPVDVAISDFPIGFYPNDAKAKEFVTSAQDTHSYAHHVLMEQAMKYVMPGGYGIFLTAANFLESEQREMLQKWFKEEGYLQGIIQLPEEMFHSKQAQKSIIIVQKKGLQAKQATQVLVARIASLKNPEMVTKFFKEFSLWKSTSLEQ